MQNFFCFLIHGSSSTLCDCGSENTWIIAVFFDLKKMKKLVEVAKEIHMFCLHNVPDLLSNKIIFMNVVNC